MAAPTIAVVGSGILGCLIAREIGARAPGVELTVLDRDAVGSGASRRSAGLHIPAGRTERVRRMAAYSQDYYRDLKRRHPSWPIHPVGMTVVAAHESAARVREAYLDQAGLARVERAPGAGVAVPPGCAVWDVEGCQYADVYALAQALARELRPAAHLREGVEVLAVEPDEDQVTLRLGTGETLSVDHAVLAPGPWLHDPAWKGLVAPLGARVKKIVALHIAREPAEHDRVVYFPDEDAFLLPLRDRGHWLFSYTCTEWDVDPDALREGLSAAHLEQARDLLRRYAPDLAARCTSGRVFCDAYSRDGEPQVQALDTAGRVVFAGAANGSGYRLAPALAAQAADLLHLPSRLWSHP
jgi:glycine/D-amino acid oxidase-like deaminating enzyme